MNYRKSLRQALAGGVAVAALAAAHGAFAQAAAFNIPAEDAATALKAWSDVSGVKIDVPAALTRGVTTAAVQGEMDAHDALTQMISGTKLQILADDGSLISLGSAAADVVSGINVTSTGTNIAGVKAIGSPIQRLNREDLLKTGRTSLKDVLSTLPLIQANSLGDNSAISAVNRGGNDNQSSGAVSDGTQTIGIGGQGGRATLILLDGQRLPQSGGNATFTDINQVPMSALGAVEVIPDGASAIYGTDAIAGVVNLVIRRNYSGVSVSADYTKDDFTPQYGGSITVGKAWNWLQGGNALITYDTHKQVVAMNNANRFTADDARPVGGNLSTTSAPASATPYLSTSACIATLPGQIAVINGSSTVPTGSNLTVPGGTIAAAENIGSGVCFDGAAAGITSTSGRVLSRTVVNYGLPPGLNGATPTFGQLVDLTSSKPGAPQAGVPAFTPIYIPADSYSPYLNGTVTYNVLATIQQKFSDSIDGSVRFNFNHRKLEQRGYRLNNINLTTTNVGSIYNPPVASALFPSGGCLPNLVLAGQVCPALTIVYPFGPERGYIDTEQFSNVATLNVALPYNWTAKFSANMGGQRNISASPRDATFLTVAGTAPGQVAYRDALLVGGGLNPYIPAYTSPNFSKLIGNAGAARNRPHEDAQLVLSGPIYNLPGGTMRASLLAAFSADGARKGDFNGFVTATGNTYEFGPISTIFNLTQTRGRRYTAEFYIPVVGEANALPGVREFTLDLAISHQNQARSKSSSNDPQVSWSYKPINDVTIHGTWGTSFRAPDVAESVSSPDQFYGSLTPTQSIGLSATDLVALLTKIGATDLDPTHYYNGTTPGTQIVVVNLGGGVASKNPNLKPETSTSISAGIDYKPSWLSGLSISASYRSYDYRNKIQGLSATNWLVNSTSANTYSNYILPVTPSSNCDPTDASTYPIEILSHLPGQGLRFASQQTSTSRVCDAKLVLAGGLDNITGTMQKSATLIASYRFNTPIGTFAADTNVTKILESTLQISPGHYVPTQLDFIGSANSLRSRSSVSWSKGAINLQIYANYTGPFTNDQQFTLTNRTSCTDQNPLSQGTYTAIASPSNGSYPGTCKLPTYVVPSWVTFDLAASYRTNADAPYWRRNLRLSMNINNFTGKAPNYAPNGGNVYDPASSNIQGRVFNFKIEKEF